MPYRLLKFALRRAYPEPRMFRAPECLKSESRVYIRLLTLVNSQSSSRTSRRIYTTLMWPSRSRFSPSFVSSLARCGPMVPSTYLGQAVTRGEGGAAQASVLSLEL